MLVSQLIGLYLSTPEEDFRTADVSPHFKRWQQKYDLDAKKYQSMFRKKEYIQDPTVARELRSCISRDVREELVHVIQFYMKRFKLTLQPADAELLTLSDQCDSANRLIQLYRDTFEQVHTYFQLNGPKKGKSSTKRKREPTGFSLFFKHEWATQGDQLRQLAKAESTSSVMKHLSAKWKRLKSEQPGHKKDPVESS